MEDRNLNIIEYGNCSYCKNLFHSIVDAFDKTSQNCDLHKSMNTTSATYLPKDFYSVLESLQNKECLRSIRLEFKDKAQLVNVSLKTNESDTKEYVALTIFSPTNYVKIAYPTYGGRNIATVYGNTKKSILFFNDKGVCTEVRKGGRFYPTTVADFRNAPLDVCKCVFQQYSQGSMIWKDFLAESFFPPIKLTELSEYHNKREFFEKQFKVELPKSVNKLPFMTTYAICCAKNYVLPEQFLSLFSNINETPYSFTPNRNKKKEIATVYLKNYLFENVKALDNSVTADYINFAFVLKESIDILAGKKKIQRLHDDYTDRMISKANYGKKLTIPETPLKYLELPKEFTLLKTKKALLFEGQRNHNCVGTYVDRVNKGSCVIYTADIDGEHLTIEICCRKKNKKYGFTVTQCYKAYNQHCKEETLQYVKDCVENSSEKAFQKYTAKNGKKKLAI